MAHSLVNYFEERVIKDPPFRFYFYLNVDGLITNIFWADAKMIRDFQIYGEVVSFDTTYRANKGYRPLALFVGLNNHRRWWYLVLLFYMKKHLKHLNDFLMYFLELCQRVSHKHSSQIKIPQLV